MSYYYTYYVGYRDKDTGLISALGPYDNTGELKNVLCRSRSFASDLHDEFVPLPVEQASEDLRKRFMHKGWKGEDCFDLKMCDLKFFPDDDFIKSGYFLIEDVKEYLKEKDSYDLFYDKLDPLIYQAMSENERKFGIPKPPKDDEGNEFEVHSCSDYMWFSYPDLHCKEYESWVIKQAVDILVGWSQKDIVILLEEG